MSILLDILSGIGNTLDVPGSMVRDTLGGENPFDQLMAPWSDKNRLYGYEVNRRIGNTLRRLVGAQEVGNEVRPGGIGLAGGVLTELATDPMSWLGVGALSKAFRGGSAAAKAGQAVASPMRQAMAGAARPAVAMSIASPVAGAYLLGDNEEGSTLKNVLGTGLMLAPLAMAAGKGAKKLTGWKRQVAEFNAVEDAKIMQRIADAKTPEEVARLKGLLSTAGKETPVAAAETAASAMPSPIQQHEGDFLEQLGIWNADQKRTAVNALREAGIQDATTPQAEAILRQLAPAAGDEAEWTARLAKARRSADSTKRYWMKSVLPVGLAGGGALSRAFRGPYEAQE